MAEIQCSLGRQELDGGVSKSSSSSSVLPGTRSCSQPSLGSAFGEIPAVLQPGSTLCCSAAPAGAWEKEPAGLWIWAAAALSLSPQGQDALGIPSCGLKLGVIFQLSHFPFARGQGLDVPLDLHGNPPEGSPQCTW